MEKIKLFCIPHAGASSIIYEKWKNKHKLFDVVPVEMAGKGRRYNESPYKSLEEGANDILRFVCMNIKSGEKYVLLGHSMGGLYVYEVAKKIYSSNLKKPEYIIMSAIESPDVLENNKKLSLLSDVDFCREITLLGGLSEDLLSNVNLLEIFLPVIKYDYSILDKYKCKKDILPFKLIILLGKRDNIDKKSVVSWKKYFNYFVDIFEFDGNHFFIYEKGDDIMKIIESLLALEVNNE